MQAVKSQQFDVCKSADNDLEYQDINLTTILDNKKIGSFLKSIRLIKSMTLLDIEAITGISYQQVKKYEDNKSRISILSLNTLMDALGLKAELVIKSSASAK